MYFLLIMCYVCQWLSDGLVIIGDVVYIIYFLVGQGVNLGLQDVFVLVDSIQQLVCDEKFFYLVCYLWLFECVCKVEVVKMIVVMEGFKQLFGGDNLLKKLICGVGMCIVDVIFGIK